MAGLFKPNLPPIPDPVRMPDPQDPALREAERQRIAEMKLHGGRLSTIMSDALLASFRRTPKAAETGAAGGGSGLGGTGTGLGGAGLAGTGLGGTGLGGSGAGSGLGGTGSGSA
jgi:hypothetical protein